MISICKHDEVKKVKFMHLSSVDTLGIDEIDFFFHKPEEMLGFVNKINWAYQKLMKENKNEENN